MGSAVISGRKDAKKVSIKSLSTKDLTSKLATCKKKHKSKIEKELNSRL